MASNKDMEKSIMHNKADIAQETKCIKPGQ